MKNIHILPTDKPSRLSKQLDNPLVLYKQFIENRKFGKWSINQNIYITNSEEIKEGEWCYVFRGGTHRVEKAIHNDLQSWKKIILTTDQYLIADGIQSIDDEFLEWFVKNPSCKEVEVERDSRDVGGHNGGVQIEYGYYEIIIPKEEHKQETLEEAIKYYAHNNFNMHETNNYKALAKGFKAGVKWQQERSYSEEDMRTAWNSSEENMRFNFSSSLWKNITFEQWLEQFKKK